MYSSIDARSLRSEELRSLFDPTQSSNYFAKPSMLIKHTVLDRELMKRELSRKHVPYEPTSLFRCLAESLYYTQFHWKRVKSEVLDYLDSFLFLTIKEEVVEGETEKVSEEPEEAPEEKSSDEEAGENGIPALDNSAIVIGQVNKRDLSKMIALVESVDEVKDSLDPGPTFDQSMELLPFVADYYKVKIIVFREDQPDAEPIVFLPRDRIIGLDTLSDEQSIHRLTISPSGHFDRVLTFEKVRALSFTQSIVYENLFTKVFGYAEEVVRKTVKEMLYEKKYSKLRTERKRFARERGEKGDTCDLPDELAALPPISYKTAKGMDVAVYRNVTMDCWLQKNKERFIDMKVAELEPSSKCIVTLKPRGCANSGQVGKRVVGTIVSKNKDNLFRIELLPSTRVVFVGLDQVELLSKRKERQAYYSGSQSRVMTPTRGRSSTTETVVEEPTDTTYGGLDTNFPALSQRNYNPLWFPPTNYYYQQSYHQQSYHQPSYHQPSYLNPYSMPYVFPSAGGMNGTIPNRFIPNGYQAPFVSPLSQGATMPQPPVYVTQPSMVSSSPPTHAAMSTAQPIPSVPPQVLVHSGLTWLPASPPLTPFNPSMYQTETAAQGWQTRL